jgi:hypothetical protein
MASFCAGVVGIVAASAGWPPAKQASRYSCSATRRAEYNTVAEGGDRRWAETPSAESPALVAALRARRPFRRRLASHPTGNATKAAQAAGRARILSASAPGRLDDVVALERGRASDLSGVQSSGALDKHGGARQRSYDDADVHGHALIGMMLEMPEPVMRSAHDVGTGRLRSSVDFLK